MKLAEVEQVLREVESSMVKKIGYIKADNSDCLAVMFKNGKIYLYKDIDKDSVESIFKQESIGKAINNIVINKQFCNIA